MLRPRKEIIKFAQLMEFKLAANDHKTTWKRDGEFVLFKRLTEEVEELRRALPRATKKESRLAILEAVDVANFAMMIADNLSRELDEKDRLEGDEE